MTGTFSSVALLTCLGFEKARSVLQAMDSCERYSLAFEAATTTVNDDDINEAIDNSFVHINNGVPASSSLSWCSDFDPFCQLSVLSDGAVARFISYLTSEEASEVITSERHRVAALAVCCSAINTLDHFSSSLSELSTEVRGEIIDEIAVVNVEVANQLQLRFNGLVDILDLDYEELAAMLGGGPVEEIAGALMASGVGY